MRQSGDSVIGAMDALVDVTLPICVTDRAGRILHASTALCDLAGHPRETLIGQDVTVLAPGGDCTKLTTMSKALESGLDWQGELALRRSDDATLWISAHAAPVREASGAVSHVIFAKGAFVQGETVAATVAPDDQQLAALIALSGVGGWSLTTGARGPVWDAKVREIHGYYDRSDPSLEDALGFLGPEARAVLADAIHSAMVDARPFDLELPLAGEETWVRVVGQPVVRDGRVSRLDGVYQDVTERRGREAAVARLQARFEAIVQNTPVAISLRDRFGTIHLANTRYETIAGRRNVSGLFEADLFPDDVADQLVAHDREALAAGRPVVAEDTYVHQDGSSTTLLTARFLIEDAVLGDRVICAIGADITEQKALQVRLEQARAEAEAATRAKADFLSTISHELRTPMNGVVGMAETLFQSDLSDEQRASVAVIRDSGKLLVALLNDLLDFAKVERGAITLEKLAFRPQDLVAAVAPAHVGKATAKGVALDVAVSDVARAARLGDPLRLQQILHNLVGNAVKFTDAGHVRVSIDNDASGGLRLSVSDTGIGMTPDQAARVFDGFTQADPTIARRFGGTGLGLSIVKGLVNAMGGDIRLETRPSIGSTFTVTLPLELAPGPIEEAPPSRPGGRMDTLSGRRILVADDNEINRTVLTAYLGRLGVEVVAVDGGGTAVAAARQSRFDALLLDVVMPDLDGPEALARIRAEEAGAGRLSPPAVAVTGRASAEEIEACLKAGFAAHLAKPIDEERLKTVLDGLIGVRPTRT